MRMSASEIRAYVDTLPPEEVREHAERFVFVAANCIREVVGTNDYNLWLPLFYNNMPVETVDYLLGKMGENPAAEAFLQARDAFVRRRIPEESP